MSMVAVRRLSAAVSFLAALCFAAPANAAFVQGPQGPAFYTPPAPLPAGAQGDLVSWRATTVNLGAGAPAVRAYNVMYRSTDAKGASKLVTGTVMVPTTGFSGARPIVSYAPGTAGLGPQCAPSKQLAAGGWYEKTNIVAALKKGWAVATTDYAGYTTGDRPTYLDGSSEGRNVLDIVKASAQVPGSGLVANTKVGLWGYSQGGQAVSFAGELKSTYAPAVNLVGVAAGGVPGDFQTTARVLNKAPGASFLLAGVLGLTEQYPELIPLNDLVNSAGQAAIAKGRSQCVFEALNEFSGQDIQPLTKDNLNLEQLMAIPSVKEALDKQKLGTRPIPVPVYQYHGQADEFIPVGQAHTLKKAWCARGVKVKFDLYKSEHIVTQTQAGTYATNWLDTRFRNQAIQSNCNNAATPPSTAVTNAQGDLLFGLDKWPLSGNIYLDRMSSRLTLPAGSTFSGLANITTGSLSSPANGIFVPDFNGTVNLGIQIGVRVGVQQAAAWQGTSTLDDNGVVRLAGTVPAIVRIKTLRLGLITLGANCRTKFPVQIPYSFEGSVGDIGAGLLTSSRTASIPEFVDCGAYGPLLSALASAPNNRFTFTQTPPAPVAY